MKNSEKRRLRRRGCTVIRSHISAIKRKTEGRSQRSGERGLYSTLLPQAGRQLELCWRTSWDSHPSEDLSEPRKQKYHCRLTGSWRGQLAKAALS